MVLEGVFAEPQDTQSAANVALTMAHIAWKGLQMGPIISPLFILPNVFFRKQRYTYATVVRSVARTSLITSALACVAGAIRLGQSTADQNYDRAYRLFWNPSQNRTDRLALYGTGLGILPAIIMNSPGGLLGRFGLLAIGGGSGVLLHVLTGGASSKS